MRLGRTVAHEIYYTVRTDSETTVQNQTAIHIWWTLERDLKIRIWTINERVVRYRISEGAKHETG